MEKQRTLRIPVELKGVGLHTGKKVMLNILPAPKIMVISFNEST